MTETAPQARPDNFFSVMALIVAVLIFASFSMTYYVPLATSSKQFTLLRHLHGLVFFAWTVLIVVQPWLVRSGQIRRHREVGLLGAALAGSMVPLGLWMATVAIQDRINQKFDLPFEFALYNLVDIALFALAIGWAIREASRRIDWHRRLVFVSMLLLLGPASSRLWFVFESMPFPFFDMAANVGADMLFIALAMYDRKVLGRLHPVTLWSIVVLVPFHVVEPYIARSAWWNSIAPTLFGFA